MLKNEIPGIETRMKSEDKTLIVIYVYPFSYTIKPLKVIICVAFCLPGRSRTYLFGCHNTQVLDINEFILQHRGCHNKPFYDGLFVFIVTPPLCHYKYIVFYYIYTYICLKKHTRELL